MEPAPGMLITRNVRLVRPLDAGGMGSVWVAEHMTLETEVAVKLIAQEHASKPRFLQRFRREASSAAKIKSPHVVQVFDYGVTDDSVPYIVMELLEGESVGARLQRLGRLTPHDTSVVVTQVAKALSVAHAKGVVHRDLKPDNLFLVEAGYALFVKVLDFGIAKQTQAAELSELTDTGAVVGTPFYMSPEMLMSTKEADHRADLWALAVVAYHLVTGRLPFEGKTLAALSVRVNDGVFAPPSALVEGLSSQLDAWFKIALCRNVGRRFQAAVELADALAEAIAEEPSGPGDAPAAGTVVDTGGVDSDPAHAETRAPSEDVDDEMGADSLDEGPTAESAMDPAPVSAVTRESKRSTLEGAATSTVERPPTRRAYAVVAALLGLGTVAWLVSSQLDETSDHEPVSAVAPTTQTTAPETTTSAVATTTAAATSIPTPASTTTATASLSFQPRARVQPARPRAPEPPPMETPPAPATATKSIDCTNKFIAGPKGDLIPRPECM